MRPRNGKCLLTGVRALAASASCLQPASVQPSRKLLGAEGTGVPPVKADVTHPRKPAEAAAHRGSQRAIISWNRSGGAGYRGSGH